MTLELHRDNLEGLDESTQALYIEQDGKFMLDVSGVEDVTGLKKALSDERGISRTAKQQANDLRTKYKDIDPDKYRQIMAQATTDAEKKLIADGDIDAVIASRMALSNEENKKRQDADNATIDMFSKKSLHGSIRKACVEVGGMHKGGISDAILRAESVFTVDRMTGKTVKLGSDGNPVLGKDGVSPLAPLEWLESMKPDNGHWWIDGNTGSGADGEGKTKTGKTMPRAEFGKLDPTARAKHISDGGIVV